MKIKLKLFTTAFTFVLLIAGSAVHAQQMVVIDDPDLTFGYNMPDGWAYVDEELHHRIFQKSTRVEISITYIEDGCKVLADCLEGEVHGLMPSEYNNLEVKAQGKLVIAGQSALWARCTGMVNKTEVLEIGKYFFKWENQFFKITVKGAAEDVEYHRGEIDFVLGGFYIQRR